MKRVLPALKYAAAGVLATLAGMSVGHLVASALNPASSPVLAVGATVIDLTPTPMKEWAVREFGTKDKPILIGSVMLVTLLLTAVAGVIARRRFAIGAAVLALLVAVAGVLALLRPFAVATDVVPAVAAALVGFVVLAVLVHLMRRSDGVAGLGFATLLRRSSTSGEDLGGGKTATEIPDDGKDRLLLSGDQEANRRGPGDVSRRTVLVTSALVAVLSGGMGWLGQHLVGIRTRPEDVDLPAAADTAKPLARGLENRIKGISRFQTPNKDFYRVDVNLTVPVIDLDSWRLEIDGDVENELSYSFDDLLGMDLVERDITLTCVSNQVGGPYVGSARWIGVPLQRLLDEAGVGSGADQILTTATDGFTISTPLDVALDGRDTMVALGMNGEALPSEHGFPARLVTPGVYGFVGATKWLRKITLTTYAKETSYWTDRDWATDAPIKISSRIDTPQAFKTLKKENAVIAGVAWAQTRGIEKVEVAIDGGRWQQVELGPSAGVDYWRQWFFRWQDAQPGQHMIAVRATGMDGEVQTPARANSFPDGSSGIQSISINVE
ncbi:MAG: molybdopterin-dependent oxidoreductase [Nocardioides sp.]